MIHAREDYNRIQDPENKILKDEPVFLLRAQDISAPDTLREYAYRHVSDGGSNALAATVLEHADLMEAWQKENKKKIADL